MANTESTPIPLAWTRRRPGYYTTDLDNERAGYVVFREAPGAWGAWGPVRPETNDRDDLGVRATMRECKALCEAHAATPTPATTIPAEWVDQLVTILDADVPVTVDATGFWHATGSPFQLSPGRIGQVAIVAIERGICAAVKQHDGSERIYLTERFRVERAAKRGIVVGAIVSYQSPRALRPNAGRWQVAGIEGEHVRLSSIDREGVSTMWPVERAVLSDQHGYAAHPTGFGGTCRKMVRNVEGAYTDCGRPADHPIHT